METATRALKARELEELKGYVSPAIWTLRAGLFLIAAVAIGTVFAGLNHATGWAVDLVWWPYATVAGALGLFLYAKRWTGGPRKRDAIRADIAEAAALDHTYHVTRALRFEEIEDEGDTVIVEEADGAAYCFTGQELPRGFPKRRVVVSEAPKSSISFAVRMSGDRVTPITATIPFRESPFHAAVAPIDRTVVPLDATFQAILDQTPHR